MTDMTLGLSLESSRGLSLEEELKRAGIPTIDNARVQKHMKDMVEADCWTTFGKFFNFATHIFHYLSLRLVFKTIMPTAPILLHFMLAAVAAILLLAAAIPAAILLHPAWILWATPAVAWVVAFAYVFYNANFGTEAYPNTMTWEMHSPLSFFEGIPERLRDRVKRAKQIPGVRIKVLAEMGGDPFVVSQRGFGPWKEGVPIGAWGTYSDMDDI